MEVVFYISFEKIWRDSTLKIQLWCKRSQFKLKRFYQQLLDWWADFRNAFSDINYAHYVIWNNKEIRIDNKSVFIKKKICRLWNSLFK